MTNLAQIIKEIDGVEFHTEAATGDSGVSQSGLAVLCGVSRQAVSRLLKSLSTKSPSRWLEPIQGKVESLTTNTESGMQLCRGELSIAVIKHYAFKGNTTAQFTLDKFATIGFNVWVQSITGWRPVEEKVEPSLILPTSDQLEFMRSRAWEKAEMEGKPMKSSEIREKSGFFKPRLLGINNRNLNGSV